MSSVNNLPREEPQSCWKQTLIGIPLWLLALALLLIVLYYAYENNAFAGLGLEKSPNANLTFADRSQLNVAEVSPLSARVPAVRVGAVPGQGLDTD